MTNKQKPQPEAFACPIEKMAYLTPFKLSPSDHEVWILQDYHEQSITDDGALCRDKPITIRSNTGVTSKLVWGSMVYPTNVPTPKPEVEEQSQ